MSILSQVGEETGINLQRDYKKLCGRKIFQRLNMNKNSKIAYA